jgi:hypothetical protein
MGWLFALGGALAGMAQARLLARSARSRTGAVSIFARLLLVGAVLLPAARAGHLASGTAGWMAGFAAAGVLLHRGLR